MDDSAFIHYFGGGFRDRDFAREGLVALEGRIVIEKAVESGYVPLALACVPPEEDCWRSRLPGDTPILVFPKSELARLSGYPFHRGALAIAQRKELRSFDPASDTDGHVVVLWYVGDPDNVGALIRTAVALGAGSVAIGPGCSDIFGRKAVRSSMGNAFSPRIVSIGPDATERVRESGRVSVAAWLGEDSHVLSDDFAARVIAGKHIALFLGNEGFGLPPDIAHGCDGRVFIPMHGGADSLNVGAAGAILMYELFGKAQQSRTAK